MKVYCQKCHHHHTRRSNKSSSISPSQTASSSSEKITYSSVIMQANHCSLLGLDRGFLRRPKFQGSVYNVGFARNYLGQDSGSVCVVKWVRSSHHCSEDHLAASVRTAEVAAEIVWNFLHSMKSLSWAIMINKPRVVVCDQSGDYGGKYAIMEPYIRKFQKFNCNSGWAIPSDRTYAKILQALSHFSYVWSGGKYLLCDLQGGVDVHSKTIYLTDPAILTEQSRQFGCSDTGKKAMRNFFHHHVCNELCHHLTTPKDKKLFFRPLEATMVSQ